MVTGSRLDNHAYLSSLLRKAQMIPFVIRHSFFGSFPWEFFRLNYIIQMKGTISNISVAASFGGHIYKHLELGGGQFRFIRSKYRLGRKLSETS